VSFDFTIIHTIYTKFIDKIQKKFKNCHQNYQLILIADSQFLLHVNLVDIIKSKAHFSQEKSNPAFGGA
jgi:hypothetical protein